MYFSFIFFAILLLLSQSCNAQSQKDHRLLGGPCDGCEAVFEYGNKEPDPIDTLPAFDTYEPKLKITGTIYQPDGKTPAPDVILYIYHTNPAGKYPTTGDEKGWGKKHGYIRGWVKTGRDGRYTFYTHKPGSYGSNPAHIHATVLEPNCSYYYIDEFHFESDPLLKNAPGSRPYGGNGIIKIEKIETNFLKAERDIILGLNVPGYE